MQGWAVCNQPECRRLSLSTIFSLRSCTARGDRHALVGSRSEGAGFAAHAHVPAQPRGSRPRHLRAHAAPGTALSGPVSTAHPARSIRTEPGVGQRVLIFPLLSSRRTVICSEGRWHASAKKLIRAATNHRIHVDSVRYSPYTMPSRRPRARVRHAGARLGAGGGARAAACRSLEMCRLSPLVAAWLCHGFNQAHQSHRARLPCTARQRMRFG